MIVGLPDGFIYRSHRFYIAAHWKAGDEVRQALS
jgi:hypothetical protein